MTSTIEWFDHHKMQILGAFFAKVLHKTELIGAEVAVLKIDRIFCLFGHDILKKMKKSIDWCFATAKTDKLRLVFLD